MRGRHEVGDWRFASPLLDLTGADLINAVQQLLAIFGSDIEDSERPGQHASLYDLGLYPAAVPDEESRVWGEVFELKDPTAVLEALDEIEGYSADHPDTSLYVRRRVPVHLDDDTTAEAWVYFYNAPLGRATRIRSGDYLSHLKMR